MTYTVFSEKYAREKWESESFRDTPRKSIGDAFDVLRSLLSGMDKHPLETAKNHARKVSNSFGIVNADSNSYHGSPPDGPDACPPISHSMTSTT